MAKCKAARAKANELSLFHVNETPPDWKVPAESRRAFEGGGEFSDEILDSILAVTENEVSKLAKNTAVAATVPAGKAVAISNRFSSWREARSTPSARCSSPTPMTRSLRARATFLTPTWASRAGSTALQNHMKRLMRWPTCARNTQQPASWRGMRIVSALSRYRPWRAKWQTYQWGACHTARLWPWRYRLKDSLRRRHRRKPPGLPRHRPTSGAVAAAPMGSPDRQGPACQQDHCGRGRARCSSRRSGRRNPDSGAAPVHQREHRYSPEPQRQGTPVGKWRPMTSPKTYHRRCTSSKHRRTNRRPMRWPCGNSLNGATGLSPREKAFPRGKKQLFISEIAEGYDGFEVIRQHELKEEAARIKTNTEVEAEATKRMAFKRACSSKPSDSGVGPMVARGTSNRNDPIGELAAAKKTQGAIKRLIAAKGS